jgi:hypothetical protein
VLPIKLERFGPADAPLSKAQLAVTFDDGTTQTYRVGAEAPPSGR